MAAHQTEVYTIWCILSNEVSLFPIKIDSDKPVFALKEKIKEERKGTLAKVDPAQLTLYRVEIPNFEDMENDAKEDAIRQKLSKNQIEMGARKKLANVFEGVVDGDDTIVLVRYPISGEWRVLVRSTTPPNHFAGLPLFHTPLKDEKELLMVMEGVMEKYRPQMRKFLKKAKDTESVLPTWTPKYSQDAELSKHISDLRIPTTSGGLPSLLLHDLGEERDELDKDRVKRIPKIFGFSHHTVLINTSGSGKTRILLEGLCRRWGFYFVAMPDMTGIGSGDVWDVMRGLINASGYQKAKHLKDNEQTTEAKAAFTHMREVVERRFCQLILARFLLLDLFIEEAYKLLGELPQEEYCRLWVLLQVQPKLFGGDIDDIFTTITRLLRLADPDALRQQICRLFGKLSRIRKAVPNPNTSQEELPPFYCVLDEAQITTTEGHGDFISDDASTKRPILREIWITWSTILRPENLRIVLSGTGVDQQSLQDTLASVAGKAPSYSVQSDIGAFDSSEAQAVYIKGYLPAPWLDPQWAEFLTRAWTWLRGRYRYTSTIVSLVLAAGYQCPNETLDAYVKEYTNFKPTDKRFSEPSLPADFILGDMVTKLNFNKMSKTQVWILSDVVFQQIVYGCYDMGAFSSTERATFVEYGFARKKLGTETVLDEPLALLAALEWLNQDPNFSFLECLRRDISKHSPDRNGFEAYLAFHLRKRFENNARLDDIFTFREGFAERSASDLAWQHEEFELVTVTHREEGNSPLVSVVTPSSSPSSNIGFSAKTGDEVLEWISFNSHGFAFCFPPVNFGPDLAFFIRSKQSQKLLLVLAQAKNHKQVERHTLMKGVRTVTPSWLWKSKELTHRTVNDAGFVTPECARLAPLTQTALKNIPLALSVGSAAYPVLRVFASWPGEPGLGRTLKSGKKREDNAQIKDTDEHPLATLNLTNFNSVGRQDSQAWFLGDAEQGIVVPSKRSNEDSELLPPPKRPRWLT